MKKFLAVLFVLLMVLSLGACKKVAEEAEVAYDLSSKGQSNGKTVVSYDRARIFYDEYNRLVDKYGKADLDGDTLKGVAVVRLLDFTGTGKYELYVAYADGTESYVNKQMIVGFDNGVGYLLDKDTSSVKADIVSKATADAETPSIWLYTGTSGRGYVVTGDNMNAEPVYNTYVRESKGEKVYTFQPEDIGAANGKTEKINLTGLTEEDFSAITEENQRVIESLRVQANKNTVK